MIDLSRIRGRVNDVPLEDVYTRPFHRLWTDLSKGKRYNDAVQAEASRLAKSIETDLQLASRSAAQAAMEADERIVGYKRVLSDKPNHCPLCVVAATNTYSRGDLMPIHPACGCSVDPVYEGSNGSHFLDDEVSNAYKRALEAGSIAVSDHGEYGPYLQAA
ncbi:hypothetical protein ACQPYK_09405 [Streptosporangium sp. CA-135522]|uniref:hypothetical protein n=1 Tax=Streptosporangium sp. CA-135522 TaxID=3240072 RepID=UPI003D910276